MNYALLENVQALLDQQKIPNIVESRAQFLAQACSLNVESVLSFLQGESPLPSGEVRKIADKFAVDLAWLVGRY